MDFADRIRALAERAGSRLGHLKTEEATKNALIMPFISALGYDVFDPTEVVPEFVADVGTKKGEKVDYAILRDGTPIMLFECKTAGTDLGPAETSQLFRYFTTTETRFGVLTNGTHYQFYSDLDAPNRMDTRPFLVFEIGDVTDDEIEELKKFSKETFDLDGIIATANDLKYSREIGRQFAAEYQSPSEDLVRLLTSRVYDGRLTKGTIDQFTGLVRRSFRDFVNGQVNQRLKSALEGNTQDETGATDEPEPLQATEEEIVTTNEELQGFFVVRAILAGSIDPKRVVMRDARSYCAVLLDDNNRKPICRLRFNTKQRYLGVFDESKNEDRKPIGGIEDIYKFARRIKQTVQRYEEAP